MLKGLSFVHIGTELRDHPIHNRSDFRMAHLQHLCLLFTQRPLLFKTLVVIRVYLLFLITTKLIKLLDGPIILDTQVIDQRVQ